MAEVIHTREYHDEGPYGTGPSAVTIVLAILIAIALAVGIWWLLWGAASPVRIDRTVVVPQTQTTPQQDNTNVQPGDTNVNIQQDTSTTP